MKPLAFLLVLLPLPVFAVPATQGPKQPNIILILADDLGYGDLGVFYQNARRAAGQEPSFATPHLDRMAAEGATLTHHYCAAPVCAPARASLLLGVHQGHANVRDNQFDKGLEDNHTLGTVLRRAGYTTALIGKWGLHGQAEGGGGANPDAPAHPFNRGFDSFFGYLRHVDGHEHYPKEAPYFGAGKRLKFGPVKLWDGRADVTADFDRCYSSDLFTARAKKFIVDQTRSGGGRPFFLCLTLLAPHVALELPTGPYPAGGGLRGGLQWIGQPGRMINTAEGQVDSWIDPEVAAGVYDDDGDPATPPKPWPEAFRRHATMVRRLDDCVADLLQLLADLHLDENTLVVFTSDNGPERVSFIPTFPDYSPTFFSSYGPFDGIKRDLWEGGIRVPAIVRWPGHVPAGRVVAEPGAHWDWLPTFAAAAGLPAPARADGVSLLPALTGSGPTAARGPLPFEYAVTGRSPEYAEFEPGHRNRRRNQMQAVRDGDLVGVRYDVKSADDPFEIYNIVTDPKQAHNLVGDPAYVAAQRRMQSGVLQSRRPDDSAARPYDTALVPAVAAAVAGPELEWRAFAGPFPWVPDFSALEPRISGLAPRPDTAAISHTGPTGLLWRGFLRVPSDGEYTFHLATDTGAELRLHDATVIDADFHYAGGSEKTATVRLQAGLHPLRLSSIHQQSDGPRGLRLEWSGPGFTRQPVPDAAFCH